MEKAIFFPKHTLVGKSVSPWLLVCTLDVDEWADIQNSTANNSRQPFPPSSPKQESLKPEQIQHNSCCSWCNSNILIFIITVTTYCIIANSNAVNNIPNICPFNNVLTHFHANSHIHTNTHMQRHTSAAKISVLSSHFIYCTPRNLKTSVACAVRTFQTLSKRHQLVSLNFL